MRNGEHFDIPDDVLAVLAGVVVGLGLGLVFFARVLSGFHYIGW